MVVSVQEVPEKKKLEVDRRLNQGIEFPQLKITGGRSRKAIVRLQEQEDRKNPVPVIAIVGYTKRRKNLHYLTLLQMQRVLEEDKLFATLDPQQENYKIT